MERRRLGRTEHRSSVVALGCAALGETDQATADAAIGLAFDRGVNHVDVAPSYGDAELRLAPWMPAHRDRIFLGCKTQERSRDAARAELERSLERLGVEHFDLYQLHAVCTMDDLDAALRAGGAIEAITQARDEGLVRHIGITGHDPDVMRVHAEGLRRFPFDTVMVPMNARLYGDEEYRRSYETLLELVAEQDVGVHVIKAVARAPWNDRPRAYATWYEPFDDAEHIDPAVAFALAQPVATLCSAGDVRVLPLFLDAAERYQDVDRSAHAALVSELARHDSIFPAPL